MASVEGGLKILTASGTDTYVISEALPAVYDPKERFIVEFTNANLTTSPTLNRAGLGAKAIKLAGATALAANDIKAGGRYLVSYNGTYYQILGGSGSGGGGITALTGDVTGSGTGSVATTIKTNVDLAGSPTTTTQSVEDNSTKISTTAYADNVASKKRVANIFNTTFGTSSGSSYTTSAPSATFTFTSGGLTASGGNGTPLNYALYTSYYTNTFQAIVRANVKSTADGTGVAVGWHSANGDVIGRINMTGATKGQLIISTYRVSNTTETSRLTSLTNYLSYTNTTDVIGLWMQRNGHSYTLTASVLNGSGDPTGTPISITWTDDLVDGSTLTIAGLARPAIYTYGGSQTFTTNRYDINEFAQSDLVLVGDSETYGTNSGGPTNTFAYKLKSAIPNGVATVAGIGNLSADAVLLLPEIISIKPKVAYLGGVLNDILNSVSSATTQANIITFINTCHKNGIIPILGTTTQVTSGWTGAISNATAKANIISMNNFMLGLSGQVVTIDVNAALSTADVLNSANASSDGYHLSGTGHQVYAQTLAATLKNYVNVQYSTNSTDPLLAFDRVNSALIVGQSVQTAVGETLLIRKDQSGVTTNLTINATNGTTAATQFAVTNSATSATAGLFRANSASFTPVGMFLADALTVRSSLTNGMDFGTSSASALRIYTNGTERSRYLSSGEFLVGYSATIASELFGVRKDQNASTSLGLINTTDNTAAKAQFFITNDASASSALILSAQPASFTNNGMFVASTAMVRSNYSGGLNIGTSSSSQLSFWTNNTRKAGVASTGGFDMQSQTLATSSTPTAAATTTLTNASNGIQIFTGSTTQTVTLPVVTTLANGFMFRVVNVSSGVVTVQTSGANSIKAMAANSYIDLWVKDTTAGTGTASWNWYYNTGLNN